MEKGSRGEYALPLNIRRGRRWINGWVFFCIMVLFLLASIPEILRLDSLGEVLPPILFLTVLSLLAVIFFSRNFTTLYLFRNCIAASVLGRTVFWIPREQIRLFCGLTGWGKNGRWSVILICDKTLEEMAEIQLQRRSTLLWDWDDDPGRVPKLAKMYLHRHLESPRNLLRVYRKGIVCLEWDYERLELLLQMYPDVPWVDLA